MPAPRTKAAPTNGAPPKAAAASADTPADATAGGKPDKKVYDTEQDKIKSEIDALQVKLSAVREKIGLATKSGSANDKRNTLRAELDEIRGQQSNSKQSRSKTVEQLKALNESVQKKIKDLNAAKAKVPFKTPADVDTHIKNLETKVESGTMKLADEKRALAEISQCKRTRRQVEGFQTSQESIDADRAAADELKKQLDDPQQKALSDRFEAINAELDELRKTEQEAYEGRSKLFAERDALQDEINALWTRKKASSQEYRDANDRHWKKVNEDRVRRAEKVRAQRAAGEAQKIQEVVQRLREEAEAPAFQAQIEDCQTLIDYFSGKTTGNVVLKTAEKVGVAGVPKLELRQVDASSSDGLVARKKKGEGEEESYFVGGKSKKGRKASSKPAAPAEGNGSITPSHSGSTLNVPLPTLSALLSLSIPPPGSSAELPRVVEDLKKKKAWFEANQARVTAENIAKAEADIKRLTDKHAVADAAPEESSASTLDVTGANGGGENPAEPMPTPAVSTATSTAVPSDAVSDKLEAAQETAVAAES